MNIYLDIFEILTSKTKILNLTFNTPANKVIGSPIIGIQANKRDHSPYLLKKNSELINHN